MVLNQSFWLFERIRKLNKSEFICLVDETVHYLSHFCGLSYQNYIISRSYLGYSIYNTVLRILFDVFDEFWVLIMVNLIKEKHLFRLFITNFEVDIVVLDQQIIICLVAIIIITLLVEAILLDLFWFHSFIIIKNTETIAYYSCIINNIWIDHVEELVSLSGLLMSTFMAYLLSFIKVVLYLSDYS